MDAQRLALDASVRICLLGRLEGCGHCRPGGVDHVDGGEPVVDAITAQDYEVVCVFVDGELGYFRYGTHHARLASKLLILGLDVAESSRDTESTWKHSIWAIQHLPLCSRYLSILICYRYVLKRLSLIDLTTVILDTVELGLLVGSMILRQIEKPHAAIG